MGFPIKEVSEIRRVGVCFRGRLGMIYPLGGLNPWIFYKKRIFGKVKFSEITLKGCKTDDPFEYLFLKEVVAGHDLQALDAFWIQLGKGVCVKDRHGVDQDERFVFKQIVVGQVGCIERRLSISPPDKSLLYIFPNSSLQVFKPVVIIQQIDFVRIE